MLQNKSESLLGNEEELLNFTFEGKMCGKGLYRLLLGKKLLYGLKFWLKTAHSQIKIFAYKLMNIYEYMN